MKIEHASRVGRKSRKKLRTVFYELSQFKDKQNILRKVKLLKEIDVFINKDYCQDTLEYRKKLLGRS